MKSKSISAGLFQDVETRNRDAAQRKRDAAKSVSSDSLFVGADTVSQLDSDGRIHPTLTLPKSTHPSLISLFHF
jgi:hypothetical protein